MKKKLKCWYCGAVMVKNDKGDYLCPNKEYDGLYTAEEGFENEE